MWRATFLPTGLLTRAALAAGAALSLCSGCSTSDPDSDEQSIDGPDASDEPADSAAAPDGSLQADGPSEHDSEPDGDASSNDSNAGDSGHADAPGSDAVPELDAASPCPPEMSLVGAACVDLYEAPNEPGALPLVMFHFHEAESWCSFRGKRLCYDDEWTAACAGPQESAWPYGDQHEPGVCNDDLAWKAYNQDLLNGWPWSLKTDSIASLGQLLDAARNAGAGAAADHVEALYQATPSGSKSACVGPAGVFDLTGNVEEWTRRRDGGEPSLHGNLKGRYWSEARTCQQGVKSHGDTFRFYEIGFRCCRDPL